MHAACSSDGLCQRLWFGDAGVRLPPGEQECIVDRGGRLFGGRQPFYGRTTPALDEAKQLRRKRQDMISAVFRVAHPQRAHFRIYVAELEQRGLPAPQTRHQHQQKVVAPDLTYRFEALAPCGHILDVQHVLPSIDGIPQSGLAEALDRVLWKERLPGSDRRNSAAVAGLASRDLPK